MIGPQSANRPAHILVVDDEPNICNAVARALSLIGYRTQEANSGRDALKRLNTTAFDLMVLDMHMPEMNGIEVMRCARELRPDLLIIVLTGHATLDSAIAAVKSGAADYLLKPTVVADIAATITTSLRSRDEQFRQKYWLRQVGEAMGEAMDALRQADVPLPAQPAVELPGERFLHAGALTLDRQKRLIIVSGDSPRTAELTKGDALVMAVLMEHPEQVLACRQLVRAAWGHDLDERESQSVIRPYIFRLRHKIELDSNNPQLIRTIRGSGYLFHSS